MKKIVNKIKSFKIMGIGVIGILIFVFGITIGRYINTEAANIYQFQSSEISFNGSAIGLSATNVKDAVDQIYQLYQDNVVGCPEGYRCIKINENFVKAYTYSARYCLKGTESDCVETTCYSDGICPVGTIIDYNVKEGKTVRFHVLHDDGDTMTMQSQKTTVTNTAWYSGGYDNTKGPTTIMPALKTATDSWTNVNDITISSSTTLFTGVPDIDNKCSEYNSCLGNKYNLGRIAGTYKARLITVQEVYNNGGCTTSEKSCKAFMNNYLYNSEAYCGESSHLCKNDGGSYNSSYWTMSVSSSDVTVAWAVGSGGHLKYESTIDTNAGARAVVNVSK